MKACIGCGELLNFPTDHATCLWAFESEDGKPPRAVRMDVEEWDKFTTRRFKKND